MVVVIGLVMVRTRVVIGRTNVIAFLVVALVMAVTLVVIGVVMVVTLVVMGFNKLVNRCVRGVVCFITVVETLVTVVSTAWAILLNNISRCVIGRRAAGTFLWWCTAGFGL